MFGILVICLLLIGYVYAGYPLIMALFARKGRLSNDPQGMTNDQEGRRLDVGDRTSDVGCRVSVVIAVYNDAVWLREKLRGMLVSEGAWIGEVLVGSDGSTDGIKEVLAELGDERVRVLEFPVRRGKTAVLNEVVPQCRHEIVVMMDARQRVSPGSIEALVRRFADERIGVVSGELVFGENAECRMQNAECEHRTSNDEKDNKREWTRMDTKADASAFPHSTLDVGCSIFGVRRHSAAAEGMGAYWRYEKWIRKNEACVASVPGATGACYAIRKSLFRPIPDATILDDVAVPMQAVLQGYRCVVEEKAAVFDRPSEHSRQERVRKRRTLAGN
ncbi:MAG: glycosyltransferase, partial [Kiritimatiellae bacterium]|nr:glycosyltransferase [Kiritimatiellia bacterium]